MVGRSIGGWLSIGIVGLALVVLIVGCDGGGGGGGDGNGTRLFRVTDLGTLGGNMSEARALNASRQVVGWSRLAGTETHHAFLWQNGTMTDLGTLAAGGNSEASGINSQGVICGTSDVAGPNQRAFRYINGQMEDIGTVSPWINACAEGINDAGQIVGVSGGAAFLWDEGEIHTLPTPGGPGGAYAINRHGVVAGWFWLEDMSESFAFRGSRTEAINLGSLGDGGSTGFAINDAGDCAGFYVDGGYKRLFVYRGGVMQNIGTLGGSQGEAHGINNRGVIVGTDWNAALQLRAFVYDGTIRDLNDLLDSQSQGWMLVGAYAINDDGVIVGTGMAPGGEYHAFMARPN